MTGATTFPSDDWRSQHPAFTGPGFRRNLVAVDKLRELAAGHGATVGQLAVAWVLDHPAVHVAIVGSRNPDHLAESIGALDLELTEDDRAEIDRIIAAAVPTGGPAPEGMP
jgi:hypothetical protein